MRRDGICWRFGDGSEYWAGKVFSVSSLCCGRWNGEHDPDVSDFLVQESIPHLRFLWSRLLALLTGDGGNPVVRKRGLEVGRESGGPVMSAAGSWSAAETPASRVGGRMRKEMHSRPSSSVGSGDTEDGPEAAEIGGWQGRQPSGLGVVSQSAGSSRAWSKHSESIPRRGCTVIPAWLVSSAE